MNVIPRRTAGFTLVELMISGSIAVVGLYATMAMALTALRGNTEQRTAVDAQQYAQHLLATVQVEAWTWTEAVPAPKMIYLRHLPPGPDQPGGSANATTGWSRVDSSGFGNDSRIGRMGADDQFFDKGILLEMPMDGGVRYCAHYRLTWVTADLVRAEVRVSWPRPHVDTDKYIDCPIEMAEDVNNVGSVTLPTLVMRNASVQ